LSSHLRRSKRATSAFQNDVVYVASEDLEVLITPNARKSHGSMNSSPPNTSAQRALDAGEE